MKNRKKQIKKFIDSLEEYSHERELEDYSDDVFAKDVIYFFGHSFSESFIFAKGFDKFKVKLNKMLEE